MEYAQKLFSVAEAASELSRTANAVRQLIKKRKLARAPVPDRRVYISGAEILRFKSGEHPSASSLRLVSNS